MLERDKDSNIAVDLVMHTAHLLVFWGFLYGIPCVFEHVPFLASHFQKIGGDRKSLFFDGFPCVLRRKLLQGNEELLQGNEDHGAAM